MKILLIITLLFSIILNAYDGSKWIKLDSIENNSNNLDKEKPISTFQTIKNSDEFKTILNKFVGKQNSNINNLQELYKNEPSKYKITIISNKHKIVNKYYPNSNILKIATSYLGEVKDGDEFEYYSSGVIMVTSHYIKGNKHGVETIFDKAGNVFKKTFYRNGIKK